MCPARLSIAEKEKRGTIRPDRLPEPRLLYIVKGELAATEAALTKANHQAITESATLAREGTRIKAKDRRAKAKTKAHPSVAKLGRAQADVTRLTRNLALLREELGRAEKVAAAAAAQPVIRDGLELLSWYDCFHSNIVPPLTPAEELAFMQIDSSRGCPGCGSGQSFPGFSAAGEPWDICAGCGVELPYGRRDPKDQASRLRAEHLTYLEATRKTEAGLPLTDEETRIMEKAVAFAEARKRDGADDAPPTGDGWVRKDG